MTLSSKTTEVDLEATVQASGEAEVVLTTQEEAKKPSMSRASRTVPAFSSAKEIQFKANVLKGLDNDPQTQTITMADQTSSKGKLWWPTGSSSEGSLPSERSSFKDKNRAIVHKQTLKIRRKIR